MRLNLDFQNTAFIFEKLDVYQKAVDFADTICELTKDFPKGNYYLCDQLNRASLSISTNIAEGNGRYHKADRVNFFRIARGSAFECVPILVLRDIMDRVLEFLRGNKEMIQVIIGAILATFGGMIGIWFQAKNARRIRMDEIIAEKKIQANNESYIRIKTIEAMLIQAELEDVKNKFYEYDEWFFNTRLFLPGKFPNKWLSIKSNLIKAIGLKKNLPDSAAKLIELESYLSKLKDEAIDEIYKEMKLLDMQIEEPKKKKTRLAK